MNAEFFNILFYINNNADHGKYKRLLVTLDQLVIHQSKTEFSYITIRLIYTQVLFFYHKYLLDALWYIYIIVTHLMHGHMIFEWLSVFAVTQHVK